MAATMPVWVILWVCRKVQQMKLNNFKHYTLTMCLCVVTLNAQYCCPHLYLFIQDEVLYYYYVWYVVYSDCMQVYPLKDVHNGAQCGFMFFFLFYVQYIITVSVIRCYSYLSVSVGVGYQLCVFVCLNFTFRLPFPA